MKRSLYSLIVLLGVATCQVGHAQTEQITANASEISDGFIVRKVWLTRFAEPKITVKAETFTETGNLTVTPSISGDPQVTIGMERKRPFAIVRIPAYRKDASGKTVKLESFSLSVDEEKGTYAAAKPTADVTQSVLANGTWYKIGITNTGFHKIDASLISSMGVNPATVNPANVRVFGNGGRMLSEANFVARPVDLRENAVQVQDNGDNVFNGSDYVMFYGVGPTGWDVDMAKKMFRHQKNIYSDTAYYFITFDQGASKRIAEESAPPAGNVTVNDYNYYDVHDVDKVNPGGVGKVWYGENFNMLANNLNQSFSFDFGTNVSKVYFRTYVGMQGPSSCSFNIFANSTPTGTFTLPGGTNENDVMQYKIHDTAIVANAPSVSVTIACSPSINTVNGYLNYIEINTRRPLLLNANQLNFRDLNSIGSGNVALYQLQGAGSSTQVWDVTDAQVPVKLNGSLSGSIYSFSRSADTLREFAAVNSTDVYAPFYVAPVANQNLHGTAQVDDIIVSHRNFLAQAERLADYHRQHDHMRVVVATPEQIYNEFSSGSQDISAIRDFVRMFYKRAGTDTTQMPRYLTLFGGASYDYKDRLPNNCNYVPVFESQESASALSGFSTDDFYGFLDDNENLETVALYNTLDIGVGRLPARNIVDATVMVDKIVGYKSAPTLGAWRLNATMIADNNDGAGDHMQDADSMGFQLSLTTHNLYNENKIYLDAIPRISTPAGLRCPNANAAISDRIFKGTLFVNYCGHGNTKVWAEERILTADDFNKWSNKNMLPFMVTATCDFGQFDHPDYVSAAEQLVIHPNGGVIAMLTTTAAVYSFFNLQLNDLFVKTTFKQNDNGSWNSFGDASRIGKNATYATSRLPDQLANFRKFALLGDPALTPNFPEQFVSVDTITDVATGTATNEVKALGAYRISGHVHDVNGNTLNDFNGVLSVSFFDKPRTISAITIPSMTFQLQDNLVYKGKVTVTNGRFSYTFITPKDINYYMGTGKISQYAHNGVYDAAGVDSGISVGGFSDNPVLSDKPPVVRAYINDSLFQNGGITGANTSLFVALESETGINVTGNKLGHDLIGVLDGNIEQPYILNDFYETAPNTYQRGYITFPINGLANGKHTIRVQAWDVNNNTGEGSVDFIVVDGKVVGIENLMNYPNPFNNTTHFVFEHNHPAEVLDIRLMIYDAAGRTVREINEQFTPLGSRTNEITWDGTDNSGTRLPSGMYVYRMMLKTEQGFQSTAYQKLVIAR
ncbi:MAG: type IX secretion system sortase PorU [Taibaiella sp.]|nr:type IX secretion system sortase PorU [Taibaiella sp.]